MTDRFTVVEKCPMFDKLEIPKEGARITIQGDQLVIPDNPIIPFIEGDGIGSDITLTMRKVLETATKWMGWVSSSLRI